MGARESRARTRKRVLSVTTDKKIKNQNVSDRLSDLFIKRAYRSVIDVPSSWVAWSGPTPLVVVNRWPACQKYNWLVNRTAAVVNAAKAVVSFASSFPPPHPAVYAELCLHCKSEKERKRRKLNSTGTGKSYTHTTNMHTHKCIHNMSVCMCVCELRHLWQVARYVFCGNVDYWCNLTLLAICLSTSFWSGQPTANRRCQRLFSNHFRFPAYDDAYSVCTHTDILTCIYVCMYVYTYIHMYSHYIWLSAV